MSGHVSPTQMAPSHVLHKVFDYAKNVAFDNGNDYSTVIKECLSVSSMWRQAALEFMWRELSLVVDDKNSSVYVSCPKWAKSFKLPISAITFVRRLSIRVSMHAIEAGLASRLLREYMGKEAHFPLANKLALTALDCSVVSDLPADEAIGNACDFAQLLSKITELPTATMEIEYSRIDGYYHVFYEEIFGALVNSLSSRTKDLVVNLDVLRLKLRPTMENISTISSLKVNFYKGVDLRAQLVHRCASSLKSLYVISNDEKALFYGVDGNTVVYPNVQDLTVIAYVPDSPNGRLLVPDAVPFPKLKTLEVFLEYPYGDDVLFRGNSGTLESLTIWADKETVEMLNSSPAFGNKFTSLRKLAIANKDDFGYDTLVPKEAMARFLGTLVGSVRSLDLASPISVGGLISAVRPRRSCDNIQVLKIGQVNLTAVSILGLLQELPALAKLTCAIYDLGSELEHVATEEQPDY
ncbi:hypothetical protein IWW57_004255, partial [Coemansia sp. S610]